MYQNKAQTTTCPADQASTVIRPAYLTEDQWFVLCHRVYKALIDHDRDHALLLLVVAGFNSETLRTA